MIRFLWECRVVSAAVLHPTRRGILVLLGYCMFVALAKATPTNLIRLLCTLAKLPQECLSRQQVTRSVSVRGPSMDYGPWRLLGTELLVLMSGMETHEHRVIVCRPDRAAIQKSQVLHGC